MFSARARPWPLDGNGSGAGAGDGAPAASRCAPGATRSGYVAAAARAGMGAVASVRPGGPVERAGGVGRSGAGTGGRAAAAASSSACVFCSGRWERRGNGERHGASEMGGLYGRTEMSRPKVTKNKDGSLTARSELNWWVRKGYQLTRVALAEIKDHVRRWRNWQDSKLGDGYSAVEHFKATGSASDVARLEGVLKTEWSAEHVSQLADYDNNQKHSIFRHPELTQPISPQDIQNALKELP